MYGVPDFYQNDNVKKGTGMQWRHQVVSDLPSLGEYLLDLCKNLALYIRDCESLCLSDETVKAVGPRFYLVSMPGEVI